MQGISGVGSDPFQAFRTPSIQKVESAPAAQNTPTAANKPDSFEPSTEVKKENTDKIGFLRLMFNRLTDEQIKNVNETGQLPEKAKFRQTLTGATGGFTVQNNWFGLTNGTRTLPEGYEVRKNKLGFTRVVPKDSECFWLKKKDV